MADSISSVNAIGGADPSEVWRNDLEGARSISPKASEPSSDPDGAIDAATEQELVSLVDAAFSMNLMLFNEQTQRIQSQTQARVKEAQEDEG